MAERTETDEPETKLVPETEEGRREASRTLSSRSEGKPTCEEVLLIQFDIVWEVSCWT